MTKSSIIKYLLIAFTCCIVSVQSFAQQNNTPIQVLPQIAAPITLLNKDIYSGKPLNIGKQLGAELKFKLSKKISVGLEGQYGTINLKDNIQKTYAGYTQSGNSVGVFNTSNYINGILNFTYNKYNKNAKNLFEVGIGGGMQLLNQKENSLQISLPNAPTVNSIVYKDVEKKYKNPLAQLSLQNTFFIKPCIGIMVGVKAQYIINDNKQGYYKPVPKEINTPPDYQGLFTTNNVEFKKQQQFKIIPTIGLRFNFGGCKSPKTPRKQDDCFTLQWTNENKRDTCFKGDSLKFIITQDGTNSTATNYEIFIAPTSNLSHPQLLFTKSYPTSSFYISSILLDANKEYMVQVKLKSKSGEVLCTQNIKPVKRCADCCKDSKLPKSGN